jgi:hypothetical protein
MSVAREYSAVNQEMPKEYWDYDELEITWRFSHKIPLFTYTHFVVAKTIMKL